MAEEDAATIEDVSGPPPAKASAFAWPLIVLVRLYQATLGHFMGGHCRFHPTCSHYAVEALRVHGAFKGSWLTLRRVLRCHPFGGGGFDPVPPGRFTIDD